MVNHKNTNNINQCLYVWTTVSSFTALAHVFSVFSTYVAYDINISTNLLLEKMIQCAKPFSGLLLGVLVIDFGAKNIFFCITTHYFLQSFF